MDRDTGDQLVGYIELNKAEKAGNIMVGMCRELDANLHELVTIFDEFLQRCGI
jgi:hypothetical protein